MKRRDFLKSTAAVAGASMASRLGIAQTSEPGPKPNIVFILVDELRWPSVFPIGVNDAEDYFKRFMPNLYRHIWKKGVKFSNYYTAARRLHSRSRHHYHGPVLAPKLAHYHHPQQSHLSGPQSCLPHLRQVVRTPATLRPTTASGTSPSPTAPRHPGLRL